jgi:hypothetical protein
MNNNRERVMGELQSAGSITKTGVLFWLEETFQPLYFGTPLVDRMDIVFRHAYTVPHKKEDTKRCCCNHKFEITFAKGSEVYTFDDIDISRYHEAFLKSMGLDLPVDMQHVTHSEETFKHGVALAFLKDYTHAITKPLPLVWKSVSRIFQSMSSISTYSQLFTNVKCLSPVFHGMIGNRCREMPGLTLLHMQNFTMPGHKYHSNEELVEKMSDGVKAYKPENEFVKFKLMALMYRTIPYLNPKDMLRVWKLSHVKTTDLICYSRYILSHWYDFFYGKFTTNVNSHCDDYELPTIPITDFCMERPRDYVQGMYYAIYTYLEQCRLVLAPLIRIENDTEKRRIKHTETSRVKAILGMEYAKKWIAKEVTGPQRGDPSKISECPLIPWKVTSNGVDSWKLESAIEGTKIAGAKIVPSVGGTTSNRPTDGKKLIDQSKSTLNLSQKKKQVTRASSNNVVPDGETKIAGKKVVAAPHKDKPVSNKGNSKKSMTSKPPLPNNDT